MKFLSFSAGVKGYVLLLILSMSVGLFAPAESSAETRSVTASGMAGLQDNQAISRDNAIKDALRKAIEQAVGLLLSSETIVSNSLLVADNIYSKTQGYIKQYQILTEATGQNSYRVTLSADIGVSDLENDLGALGLLQARVGRPRTLFVVSEYHTGSDVPFTAPAGEYGATEAALKEEFMTKEFNVVDWSAPAANQTGSLSSEATDAAARESGRKTGAEIVIKCTAKVKEGPRTPGSPVGSYLADLSATAIRVDNGQVLASGRSQGAARHVARSSGENGALDQASRTLAKKLMEQIIAQWIIETSGVQQTHITVRGLHDMQELIKVKEHITGQLRGVQNIIQRSFDGGVAILDVSAKSNAQQLGDELAVSKISDLTLKVIGTTANTLEIAISTTPSVK